MHDVPKEQEELDFGLAEGPGPELDSVWNLYWVPVKRAVCLLRVAGAGVRTEPAP